MNRSEVLRKLGVTELSDMQKATLEAFGKKDQDRKSGIRYNDAIR